MTPRPRPEGKRSSSTVSLQDQLQAAPAPCSSVVTHPAPVLALTLLQPHHPTALIPVLSSCPPPSPLPASSDGTPGQDLGVNQWWDQRQPPTTHTKVRLRAHMPQAVPRRQQAWPPHPGVLPQVILGGAPWILTARPPGGGGGLRANPPGSAPPPCHKRASSMAHTSIHMYQQAPSDPADTHRADVFLNSTGAMMEADPWTDRQETFKPLVSS